MQAPPSAGWWLEMSKAGTFLRRCDELLLWSQLGLKSQQKHSKTFKNVWQVELLRLPRSWFLWWHEHASSSCPVRFFAFCSFTSVWRGAMLEEIPKPMFSFKADTWRRFRRTHWIMIHFTFTSRGTAKAAKAWHLCREIIAQTSLFLISFIYLLNEKIVDKQVCPGLCQELEIQYSVDSVDCFRLFLHNLDSWNSFSMLLICILPPSF